MVANNGAVQTPFYQPAMRAISSITQANPCVITTTFAHNYYSTDVVSLFIPPFFGMRELNGQQGQITVIDSTSFSFPYDTTNLDAFVDPGTNQFAQVLCFAENVNTVVGAVDNTLPSLVREPSP